MKRILMTGEGYTPEQCNRLVQNGFEIIHEAEISAQAFSSLIPTIDAHVLGGSERLDADAIRRAEHLRVISFVGTGYSAFVDEQAAHQRNIVILNTPGVMAQAVAEHAIGFLIGLARGTFEQNESVKRLTPLRRTATIELGNMTVGLLGMGAIGSRIARILTSGFGCKVLYANRTRKTELESQLAIHPVGIDQLFESSQAVILAVPLVRETTNIIDEQILRKAHKDLVLINVASAKLVNPTALRDALNAGQVFAAAFDGYWVEPLPTPSLDPYGLLALPDSKFVVTPHTAAKTTTAWSRMIEMAVDNVINAFDSHCENK